MGVVKVALLLLIGFVSKWVADAVAVKVSACSPPCSTSHGLCLEGRCFCRSPYGGVDCQEVINQNEDGGDAASAPPAAAADTADSEDPGDNLFGSGDGASDQDVSASNPASSKASAEGSSLKVESGDLSLQDDRSRFEVPSAAGHSTPISIDDASSDEPAVVTAPVTPERLVASQAAPSSVLPAPVQTTAAAAVTASAWQWPKLLGSLNSFWQGHRPASENVAVPLVHPPSITPRPHGVLRRRTKENMPPKRRSLFATSEAVPKVSVLAEGSFRRDGNTEEKCIPWLAELRSSDLHNTTQAHQVDDMKAMRLRVYKAHIGGGESLQKETFQNLVDHMYQGPTFDEGEALFNTLDISGDGELSFDEYNYDNVCGFRRALLAALGARQTPLDSGHFLQGFRLLDTDKDGELKEEEFIAVVTGPILGLTESNAIDIFKYGDYDGTPGVITRTEFQRLGGLSRLRAEVAEKEPDVQIAFKQADKNADGFLDAAEFEEHAQDMGDFEKKEAALPAKREIDLDNDGKIAKEEYVNKCWHGTGGRCDIRLSGNGMCHQWRGPVFCAKDSNVEYFGSCECAPGFCAKNGACIPEELHSATDKPLGPEAGNVLKQMEKVNVAAIMAGPEDVNPASGVAAVLFGIAVLMPLKLAITNFPGLGVLMFTMSVSAFFIVTVTCFRAYSVPGSIDGPFQVFLMSLVFCAVSLSITSLVRVWSPASSKVLPVCWYAEDDVADYGLDLKEEMKVRSFNWWMTFFSASCVFGLWALPLTGASNTNNKFMLMMLYAFIIILDACMLEVEVNQCANRKMVWSLKMRSGKQQAVVDCLSAWWNHRPSEGNGNLIKFEKGRQIQEASGGGGRMVAEDEECLSKPCEENELVYITAYAGYGEDLSTYVKDRVVLIWEDTEIELVVPNGINTEKGLTRWLRVDGWQGDKYVTDKEEDLAPKAGSGFLCPWVKANPAGSGQSVQEKMLIAAQAGAKGLIVGQRGIDAFKSDLFGDAPIEPGMLWPGQYSSTDGGTGLTMDDFKSDFTNRKYHSNGERIIKGCAINTLLISNLDMQEIAWALEERAGDTEGMDEEMLKNACPVTALECRRKWQVNGNGGSGVSVQSNVTRFSLQNNMTHASFRHVFTNQRHILAEVSTKAHSELQFLIDVRTWITGLSLTKYWWYPFWHLLLTGIALSVVLQLALMMYRELFVNDYGKLSGIVFAVTLLNGLNTSFYLDWWPTFLWRSGGRYDTREVKGDAMKQVGGVCTLLVMVGYTGCCIGLFVYYGILKEIGTVLG